jgi:hypothetical protein
LFPLSFPTKTLYTFLSSTMHATYPAHIIHLDLICLMIFGIDKLWSSSFWNFPYYIIPHNCKICTSMKTYT